MIASNKAVRTAAGAVLLDLDKMSKEQLRVYVTAPVTDLLHPGRVFKAAVDEDRTWFREKCLSFDLLGEWASLAARFTCITRDTCNRRLRSLTVIASKPMPFLSFKVLHRTEVFAYVGEDFIESTDEFYVRTGISVEEVIKTSASSIQRACQDALTFLQSPIEYRSYVITDGKVVQTVEYPALVGEGMGGTVVVPEGWWVLGRA